MTATLEQLEARIATLEARPAAADQIQPNYLTVAPDGSIGANFTGDIVARSLTIDGPVTGLQASAINGQLTAAQIASVAASAVSGQITSTQIANGAITTPLVAANAITAALIAANQIDGTKIELPSVTVGGGSGDPATISWIRQADGALVAELSSFQSGTAGTYTRATLIAEAPDGGNSAGIAMTGNVSGANLRATAGTQTRNVLDDSGHSDFMQSPTVANARFVTGSPGVGYGLAPGATSYSGGGTSTSGPLGASFLMLGYCYGGPVLWSLVQTSPYIQFQLTNPTSATQNGTFYWGAITWG